MFSISLSSFTTKKNLPRRAKKKVEGVRGILEGNLEMGKRGERLKGIHPFRAMKRKGQTEEYILFCLFIPVLFLRVLLSSNSLTSELQKQ